MLLVKYNAVTGISKERRLHWYGDVLRRGDDYIGKKVINTDKEDRRKTDGNDGRTA